MRPSAGVHITTGCTAKTVLPNGQNWRKSCGAVKARKATFAPKFLSVTNLCYTPRICQCPCHLHARRSINQAPGGPNKYPKHPLRTRRDAYQNRLKCTMNKKGPNSCRTEIHAGHTPASRRVKKEGTRHDSEIHSCPANSHGGEDTMANLTNPKCTKNTQSETTSTGPPPCCLSKTWRPL